jgi:hypothetical protein
MWISNVTLTMGLVDTVSIPTLLKMVASGRIPAEKMGTHSFTSTRWTRPTTSSRTRRPTWR